MKNILKKHLSIKTFLLSIVLLTSLTGRVFAHGGDDEVLEEASSTTLKSIKLSEQQKKILGLRTAIVSLSEVKPSIEVNGSIEEIPNLHFQINSPVKGKVTSINVSLGSQVLKGQTLAVIDSQEITLLSATGDSDQANYRSQFAQAKANLELERKRFEREKSLYEHKINSQKDLEVADNSLKNAQASLKAAEQNLTISSQSTQKRLKQIGGNKNGQAYLKAPLNGQISEINMTLGQTVEAGQNLMHGVNLSQVWVSGQVFEKDINKIKLNQAIQASSDSYSENYNGKIIFINPVIDSEQRSFAVKAILNNTDAKLKAGQFMKMKIDTQGLSEKAILLEKDSLIENNGEQYVYVRSGSSFTPVKVKVSNHKHQDYLEIEKGLVAGDEVVVEGAYLLSAKGQVAEDEHQHDHEEKLKSQIPLWIWITGGGIALMVLLTVTFFIGQASSRRGK